MAPGVVVSRIDTSKWAIGVRGFNGRSANKLLVLMDGPSAAVWGANAVTVSSISSPRKPLKRKDYFLLRAAVALNMVFLVHATVEKSTITHPIVSMPKASREIT